MISFYLPTSLPTNIIGMVKKISAKLYRECYRQYGLQQYKKVFNKISLNLNLLTLRFDPQYLMSLLRL